MYVDLLELNNCSLQEMSGIADGAPDETVKALISAANSHGELRTSVIFTSGAPKTKRPVGYASRLRNYIEANDLGTVWSVPAYKSRQTGNYVTVYVWVINLPKLEQWASARGCSITASCE